MSDHDLRGEAWRVAPSQYLAKRTPEFAVPATPRSCYVTMRDGVRLAVDVHLPQAKPAGPAVPATLPAVAIFTTYYPRFNLLAGPTGETSPNAGKYPGIFRPRAYAAVIVAGRRTGATIRA